MVLANIPPAGQEDRHAFSHPPTRCLEGPRERRGGVRSAGAPPLTGRRGKVVYQLTAEGKERFATAMEDSGPTAWDDESFGVRFPSADPSAVPQGRRSSRKASPLVPSHSRSALTEWARPAR